MSPDEHKLALRRGYSTCNEEAATVLLDHEVVQPSPELVNLLCVFLSALGGQEITPPESGQSVTFTLTLAPKRVKVVA